MDARRAFYTGLILVLALGCVILALAPTRKPIKANDWPATIRTKSIVRALYFFMAEPPN